MESVSRTLAKNLHAKKSEMIMSEISFQAVQFAPRFTSVIILLLFTWLVAKFTQAIVQRAASQSKNGQTAEGRSMKISKLFFWAVILLFSPFILGASGLDAIWLRQLQVHIGQFFSNWPIWMLLSLIVAGISYLFHNIPKFYFQLKGSPGSSPKKL